MHDLPPHKRPREKLAEKGSDSLSDSEILALLLSGGYRGQNAVDVATRILTHYTLTQLSRLSYSELLKLKGLGSAKASTLVAATSLASRIFGSSDLPTVSQPSDVVKMTHELQTMKQEHLVGLYLNARHQVIAKETLSIGTLTASPVHPREIFAPALSHRAAEIILVHNHPSGDAQPSAEDVEVTEKLAEAAEILDIALIDHVIVAKDGWCSLKAEKLL